MFISMIRKSFYSPIIPENLIFNQNPKNRGKIGEIGLRNNSKQQNKSCDQLQVVTMYCTESIA